MTEPATVQGIIPALAGSTRIVSSMSSMRRDHPRSRGEHSVCYWESQPGCGIIPALAGSTAPDQPSPKPTGDHPRSRGEHLVAAFDGAGQPWIIPALAGSTSSSTVRPPPTGDHPRSRGEHSMTTSLPDPTRGSSPLSRGARSLGCVDVGLPGIIPALAGSTDRSAVVIPSGWDHPRSRGEHKIPHHRTSGPHWIIPALAGSTS